MRNLALVCAGLAVIAGIVSANMWLDLRSERQGYAQVRAQLAQLQPTDGLASTVAQPDPAHNVTAPLPNETPAADADASPATNAPPRPDNAGFNSAEGLKDPEYRNAMLARLHSALPQFRDSLPRSYPGLVEELGLTHEEADQLFDLLAESEFSMTAALLTASGGQPDPAAMRESRRKQDESIASLLGASRYGQWQEYQQTRQARLQAVQIGRTLESQGQRLSATQSRHLTAAFTGEEKRRWEEMQSRYGGITSADPIIQLQVLEENLRHQAERNQRIVDGAVSQLTVQQIETLRTTLEQQLAMSLASNRVLRQQLEGQGQ